jgi:hypothetical protein
MGASVRTRPRGLLVAAAALVLGAVLFFALHAPLRAQDPVALGFGFPDGQNAHLTGEEISAGDEQVFYTGKGENRRRVSARGLTLSQALTKAQEKRGAPITGVGVYELLRPPAQPLYLPEKPDQLFFFVRDGEIRWFLYDENQRVLDRGSGLTVRLRGQAGEFMKVDVTQTPATDVKAGSEVQFTATADPAGLDGEKLVYRWFIDGGENSAARGQTFKHTFAKPGNYSVSVDVRGEDGSRGQASVTVDVGKKPKPQTGGGSGGGSGGSGGASPGGGGGGGGGGAPSYTPPPVTVPPTPSLPPPSTSPPSDPGRGPNLDPSAPSGGQAGERVEGILVSTSTPAKPAQNRRGQQARADQARANSSDDGVDLRLAGGISLTALLVILGAVRERAHIQRLLPHPQ